MFYFIGFFVLIMALESIGGSNLFDNKKNFKFAYIILFLILWIFFGIRESSILGDAATYSANFQSTKYVTWHGISWYFENYSEPFYFISVHFLRLITNSYTVYFFVTSLTFCLGLAFLFKYESEDYLLSMVLLTTLGVLTFAMAGLRQAIAIGICLLAYPYLKNRNLIPFVLCVLIASFFHNSAWFFLIAYPVYKIKAHPGMFVFVAIAFALGFTRSSIIKTVGELLTSDENYLSYFEQEDNGLKYTMYIIQLGMTVFCFFYREQICERYESGNFMFNMAILGLCIQSFATVVSEFFRLSMYFSVFLAVLVTKAVFVEENKGTRWAEFFLILVVCVYYMFILGKIATTYIPFWS